MDDLGLLGTIMLLGDVSGVPSSLELFRLSCIYLLATLLFCTEPANGKNPNPPYPFLTIHSCGWREMETGEMENGDLGLTNKCNA